MTPDEVQKYVDKRLEDRMEMIAEHAAKKVLNHFYREVGKGVLRKAAWFAGAGILALGSWLAGKGFLPSP